MAGTQNYEAFPCFLFSLSGDVMHMSREACKQPSLLLLCLETNPCVLLFKQIKDPPVGKTVGP